ncbi:MAG: macrolide family glycosyltransferase [Sarcina sp.]
MARGLFIIFPGHGHVNPTLGLVSELINKGDEIVYISSEEYRKKLENVGARFKGYTGIDMTTKNAEIHKKSLDLAFEEEDKFDYIVVDTFINPGKKIIEKFNIKKVIQSITTFAINQKMAQNIFEYNQKRGSKELAKMIKDKFFSGYEIVAEEYGIEAPKSMADVMQGVDSDLKIVFTSEYYQPYAKDFEDIYKFVGPSVFDRQEFNDFKISNTENKKLIYLSLGTLANKNFKFYFECFKALGGNQDIKVIMSIGKANRIEDLGEIPSNFEVYNYVPQLKVLSQIDLFITHGGMNSSSEALYNNIPLIVVPQMAEQPIVAARVEELGAGINLIEKENAQSIKEAVETILNDDSYKENATKIGESLRNSGGYKKAAEYINELIK